MPGGENILVSSKFFSADGAKTVGLSRPVGGVASALEGVLKKTGGNWIAWDGGAALSSRPKKASHPPQGSALKLLQLSEQQVAGWYYGFSNQVLWPLLHSFPEKCRFSVEEWRTFTSVNRSFAEAVIRESRPDDTIWVHDYQLCLVPGLLRRARPDARICFFCHVPFPAQSVFRINPWWREIVAGMLGSDVIAFHRKAHADNFLALVQRHSPAEVEPNGDRVLIRNRAVKVSAVPLGVDADYFDALSSSPQVATEAGNIRRASGSDYLMLGVDRLDYTKGLIERLRAVDLLFMTWPELRGRISLLQIGVPCREHIDEYKRLKHQVKETARLINNRFAARDWSPVRLLTESVPRERLVAFYRAADLALVTPLRDGLNLVAKEYVVCKSGEEAMLLLSKFAGVAEDFSSDAILVNPNDPVAIARGVLQAMRMPELEKRNRMQRLLRKVKRRDMEWWIQTMHDEMLYAESSCTV
jgi:alpha,alpha-trehalose-phosphate synthase [UDP-forming]